MAYVILEMLKATIVTSNEELIQIHKLNFENLKSNVDVITQKTEGFLTWLYSFDLLNSMHQLAPSIIVKEEEKVVGYALATVKESKAFHPDLDTMFRNLETVHFKNKILHSYNFYFMGQICVAKDFRGKGVFGLLYQKHKEVYSSRFDFILTEISTSNFRSLKAHEKIGFQKIHTYQDAMDEWDVVVWEWS